MDTKPLEIQAESFIKHCLINHGFNVAKPTFDEEGSDLLIIADINSPYTRILKIQCKGRTLKSSGSSIKIPISYVKDNLIVFLYVVKEKQKYQLFTFFNEDISEWKLNNDHYVLNFTLSKLNDADFSEKIFNKSIANRINLRLKKSKIQKNITADYICSNSKFFNEESLLLNKKLKDLMLEKKNAKNFGLKKSSKATEDGIRQAKVKIKILDQKIVAIDKGYDFWDDFEFIQACEAASYNHSWYNIGIIENEKFTATEEFDNRIPNESLKDLNEAVNSSLFERFMICELFDLDDDTHSQPTLSFYLFGIPPGQNSPDYLNLFFISYWKGKS